MIEAYCEACPLKGRPHVPSQLPPRPGGNSGGKFALVGEAPGRDEALLGKPFVGASGQVLNAVLQGCGLARDELLVTNAVLCQPRGNDDPPVEALLACRDRLLLELYCNDIEYVLAMGRFARNALWPDEHEIGITKNRGRWRECKFHLAGGGPDEPELKLKVLAAAHPAYYLRGPGNARDFFEDVEKFAKASPAPFIPTRVDIRAWPTDTDYSYTQLVHSTCNRLREVLSICQPIVSIDLETAGYDWAKDKILNISFSWHPGTALVIVGDLVCDPQIKRTLEQLFFYPGITWIGHNLKFDIKFMLHQLGVAPPLSEDTMIMHYALDERPGTHALKSLVTKMFDMPDYEAVYVFPYLKKKSDSFALVPWRSLAQYAGMDTDYTLRYYYELRKQLKTEGLYEWPYKQLLLPAQDAFVDIEMKGFAVDWDGVAQASTQLQGEVDQLAYQIRKEVGNFDFNPNSSKQVSREIYETRGLPQPRGRTIKPGSANKEALFKLQSQFPNEPFIALLGKYRRVRKLLSSYVDNLPKYAGEDKRVHPTFAVHGTEVGRLSVRNPALQTIPRAVTDNYGKIIRDLYIAAPGNVLLLADYSQAELRTFAVLSREPFLIDIYEHDRDLHSEVAQSMYGDDFTKEQRNLCKMFNFSFVYGGTERSFAQDSGLPLNIARDWVRRYNENMPTALAWKDSQFEAMREQGYVQFPTGNRRRFPLITDRGKHDVRKAAVHAPVAGTSSLITVAALVELHRHALPQGAYVLLTIHDSNIVECPDDDDLIAETAQVMRRVMLEQAKRILGDVVPFKVDIDVAYRWGSPVKYDGTSEWRTQLKSHN